MMLADDNHQPDGSAKAPRRSDASSLSRLLKRKILDGEFRHDERLPAERSLAQQYHCSRSTVRAAMEQLEELNLVSRRIGSGTYVNHKLTADEIDIASATSPLELFDVRRGVEPQIARLAVANASAIDIGKLEQTLNALESLPSNATPEQFTLADQAFHLTLSECTGNALMIWTYRHINDVRSHDLWNAMKDKILGPERIAQYNRQHRAIFEAIAARDVDSAAAQSINHLELARSDLMGASW